jgi:antitoxin (DNA-binding transcriptional repressor) of toxin-antitoxin stability system
VYFGFLFLRRDDVSITLPERFHADIVPQERQTATDTASYKMAIETAADGLRLRRDLTIKRTLVKVAAYDWLRNFYQSVRAGDEQHIVLSGAPVAGTK